ncbi:aminotransferase class V-fold PLP-dependent enzyme [Rubrobacter marinus]|uniref:aminotransferase class V-fold PLP-dependent enzyme n=1 Tax=Rubrobacter marinus TaxID=2653852 RepID=UPI0014095FA6|nr:aminotransferase class V-fold PLP-dependent enzyme [Rubrobacter marinus]
MDLPRKLFPALADNSFTYLNSGGSGPPTRETIEAMRELDDLCSGPAYLEGVGLYAHQRDAYARARGAAARLLNTAPDDLALTTSSTHGMNLGTFSIDWREGDGILSARPEHPGCLVPLHEAAHRYGAEVRLLDPPITPEKIAAAITPKTRLVALSHVDWTTGEELALREICSLARERGVLTLVDGAQGAGNVPVDMQSLDPDMYAFTGHKWVLGPEGMGALYVRPGLFEEGLHSTNIGFMSLTDPAAFDAEGGYREKLHTGARRFESSTMSPALAAGFAAAAEAVEERGAEGFREIRRRADGLMDLLSGQPRVTIRSPRPAHSGLVAFEIEGVPRKRPRRNS